jgi:hypothetical protein
MAAVALPEHVDEGGVDLAAYYDRHHRWFFAFFLATLVVSVAKDVVIGGHLPDQLNLGFHVIGSLGCIAGLTLKSRRSQEVLGVGFAALIVAYIGILFAHLR